MISNLYFNPITTSRFKEKMDLLFEKLKEKEEEYRKKEKEEEYLEKLKEKLVKYFNIINTSCSIQLTEGDLYFSHIYESKNYTENINVVFV